MRQPIQTHVNSETGFTLVEVLIALALLGVVAAFSVPKVLQSTQDTHKKALFRETVGEVSKIVTDWRLSNDYPKTGPEMHDRLLEKLNILEYIGSDVTADGLTNYRYTLKNGVGLRMKANINMAQFNADYNGFDEPPNLLGEDTVVFWANLTETAHCGLNPGGVRAYDPVECPDNGFGSPMQPFYDAFQKWVVE